jgi:hypothetical protein
MQYGEILLNTGSGPLRLNHISWDTPSVSPREGRKEELSLEQERKIFKCSYLLLLFFL